MIIPLFSISQDWTQYYVPYYRNVMEIHAINMHEISTLEGCPYNDSITFMSFSEDSGENGKSSILEIDLNHRNINNFHKGN